MEDIDINALVNDREAFNAFVYTPLNEALEELKMRENDEDLKKIIHKNLHGGIPDILSKTKSAVIFRQLATPNYETRRFVSIIDAIDDLEPVFWEYHEDKFTTNNECKHALAKISFFLGKGKLGGSKIDRVNVIDFNAYNGKKISEVQTLWGDSLINFHHDLFEKTFSRITSKSFFNASDWFLKSGGSAKEYYKHFIMLFVQNGILFENFMLDEKELSFTRDVFLPSFIEVIRITGHKPLIVALAPTEIEGDNFWMCHPGESAEHVKSNLLSV